MSLIAKIHAITLVFSPLLLALFYLLLLICPLIALSTPKLGLFFQIACWIFFVAAIVWGWSNTSEDSGETKNKPSLWLRIWYVVAYILIFLPLSLYYFIAIIQTAFWGKGNFHSTPKGYGRERIPHPAINTFLLGMEIFSFLFALFTLILAIYEKNYWVCLYSLIALGGFGMTLFFSFSDSRKKFLATGHILITGASGSLGNALALEYAAPGIHLTLQGRKRENLEDLAARCEEKGATTAINVLDLADTEATRQWARELAENDPPNLVIANAGLNTNIGADGKGEPFAESKALVNVNLLSTMALFDGILPAFRQRGSGQFAIVSSLASYYGLVTTPTYCATKAALRTWGTSLRGWLRSEGIHINVILPGYVSSPMCDGMPGPKPFLWEPARAAKVIRKRLEWDWARISFPFPLNLGIWSLSILPAFIAMPIARILGYGR